MTRRRPGAEATSPARPRRPVVGATPSERSSIGVWYALLIGAVFLIATALYAASLHQEVATWRQAAEQLTLGQELLRADRDEILQKAREREVALSTLEASQADDRARLDGLEAQRRRLQDEVLRLTQELARNERRTNGPVAAADRQAAVDRLERERDRLGRELEARRADVSRLETALAERAERFEAKRQAAIAETAELEAEKASLSLDVERLELQLAERRRDERLRQIVRGHRASLGEVKPYIAEVGPEDWSVIESWLALQLRRPMAVPDLADHGWSYEGARLLGSSDGPPIAMLLYADDQGRPVSLTIASDKGGERPLETAENGRLRLLDWREERHAFYLAGDADGDTLEAVALDLLNQPPRLSEDAVVPVSRYVRPRFRPEP